MGCVCITTSLTGESMGSIDIYPLDNSQIALSTLAGATAILVNTALVGANLDHKMLLKRLRLIIGFHGLTAGEGGRLMVGCAIGDISVADIAGAINLPVVKEGSVAWLETQGIARRVLWETIRPVIVTGDGTTGYASITGSLGGGKGIPLQELQGMSVFVYNLSGNSLTTGGLTGTMGVAYGVPL